MHSKYLNITRAVPPRKPQLSRAGNFTCKKDKLFVCPECRVVWENVVETGHVKAHDEWYPVLPRYGKPKKTCPRCK